MFSLLEVDVSSRVGDKKFRQQCCHRIKPKDLKAQYCLPVSSATAVNADL